MEAYNAIFIIKKDISRAVFDSVEDEFISWFFHNIIEAVTLIVSKEEN